VSLSGPGGAGGGGLGGRWVVCGRAEWGGRQSGEAPALFFSRSGLWSFPGLGGLRAHRFGLVVSYPVRTSIFIALFFSIIFLISAMLRFKD